MTVGQLLVGILLILDAGRLSASAGQDFGCQKRVHRAGPEALEVESHELEAQSLEDARKFGGHLRTQCTTQFLARNFDTDDVSMMTNPNLEEAESVQSIFTL